MKFQDGWAHGTHTLVQWGYNGWLHYHYEWEKETFRFRSQFKGQTTEKVENQWSNVCDCQIAQVAFNRLTFTSVNQATNQFLRTKFEKSGWWISMITFSLILKSLKMDLNMSVSHSSSTSAACNLNWTISVAGTATSASLMASNLLAFSR